MTFFLFPSQIIRLRREEESIDNIGQYWVQCETPELKYNAIANIYGVVTIGQAMIFCQTRKTASWLVQKMTKDGHAVALLSGELTVEERIQVRWEFMSFFAFGFSCLSCPPYTQVRIASIDSKTLFMAICI